MTDMEEQAYEDFADSSSWASMDPELKEAACCGDVDFLKSAIASSKPPAYFLSRFTPSSDNNNDDDVHVRCAGNILHLAIFHGRVEFVAVAMSMLPEKIIHFLLSQQETTGGRHWNPLHVAVWKANRSVVELIANCGNGEVFVAQDSQGRTPALLAIETGKSEPASILTTGSLAELIKNVGDHQGGMPLYWAVCNGLYDVVLNLLECQGTLCCTGPDGSTALHVMTELASAPQDIQDEIFGKLLRRFSELTTAVTDNWGFTVLHKWVHQFAWQWRSHPQGLMRTFEYFFDHYPDVAVELMRRTDCCGNNPLHVIAINGDNSHDWHTVLAEKLTDLYRECTAVLTTQTSQNHEWPWLMKNQYEDTPLLKAIRYKRWDLAWCFIRKTPFDFLSIGDQKTYLMLDVQIGCSNFGPDILRAAIKEEPLMLLLTFGDESNILHLRSRCPEKLIEKVLHEFPSLIIQPDRRGVTPLDKASAGGMESLVQLMLRIDPSSLKSSPSAWIKACENGHVSVILFFIKHYPNFKGFCHGRRNTPLHHIKLGSYEEYKEFLVIDKLIEEQKNTQDMDGATPLHRAIAREDMDLAEALLTDGADRTIKDKDDKTALDLVAEVCKHNDEWYTMCKRVGIDPRLTTTYVQRETNLLEMRGALSVVAGLLATITFTAGFTLPGGFNNDTGEALLAKDAAFLVFLLADAYAMCCSMLVLFCLIWSMLSDGDKTLLLIDRSVVILLQSLYATLVAFMTGVFTVIFHKSLWAAIVVFVMCSVIGISATIRSILFWLIDKMVPSTDTENGYQNRLLKVLGKTFASKRTGSQESSTAIAHIVQLEGRF
ncbi:hypothetical protein Cgig2_006902 [Carnegiea gigantea]|uniref:PGG domain-containing protein n=1 Tax=Carnegiea gigantea TaxID=171969 RepID=A0A9Q1QCY6_9CARY|nr:hypothetical protein Cgig2_006902 [Carnegiea gigantea]